MTHLLGATVKHYILGCKRLEISRQLSAFSPQLKTPLYKWLGCKRLEISG